MTAKTWNICVLMAILVSISLIGAGVGLTFGLGYALTASGSCLLVCVVTAALKSVRLEP